MGRPLYSTLLVTRRATEEAATQPPPPVAPAAAQAEFPVIEKWSQWNSFDPDSDEFFQAEDAVYEAFLTEDEIMNRGDSLWRERARRVNELSRPDVANDGQRNAGLWVDGGDANLVASPRPMSAALEGSEAASPQTNALRNLSDGGNQTATRPDTTMVPPTALPITVSGNRVLEPFQPIPSILSSRNASPVPNTPARISGFFSPRRRMTVSLGSMVDPPPISRHVDIRMIPAPEPLIS